MIERRAAFRVPGNERCPVGAFVPKTERKTFVRTTRIAREHVCASGYDVKTENNIFEPL